MGNRRSDTLARNASSTGFSLWLVGNRRSDPLVTAASAPSTRLWLGGNRRSDTLTVVSQHRNVPLWLVGNRRSDTLRYDNHDVAVPLWLVGNRRSDTLPGLRRYSDNGCGLWGIAARIHWKSAAATPGHAVACGESPLGYTDLAFWDYELLLWLVGNRRSDTLIDHSRFAALELWLVGNRRSDTLLLIGMRPIISCGLWGIAARIHSLSTQCSTPAAVACGESPLGYTTGCKVNHCCSAVACGESPLGYTSNSNHRIAV